MPRPRPDTLQLDATGTSYHLNDYPASFDVSTIPDYSGTSAARLLSADGARWSLMTRVAGYIDEHERRKAQPRDYETFPDTGAGGVDWELWAWAPLNRLSGADQHLVRHGAVGPTAARYYGGGLETRDNGHAVDTDFQGLPPGDVLAAVEALETATVPPPLAPTQQPPAVKVGDRVLGRWGGSDSVNPDAVFYVREITAGGRVMASARPDSDEVSWAVIGVIEVLPPRATEET